MQKGVLRGLLTEAGILNGLPFIKPMRQHSCCADQEVGYSNSLEGVVLSAWGP